SKGARLRVRKTVKLGRACERQGVGAVLKLSLKAHIARTIERQYRDTDDDDQHHRHVGQDEALRISAERPGGLRQGVLLRWRCTQLLVSRPLSHSTLSSSVDWRPRRRDRSRTTARGRAADNIAWSATRPSLTLSWCPTGLRPLIALDRPNHPFAVAANPAILHVARPGIDHVRGGVDVLGIAGAERHRVCARGILSRGIFVNAAP